jgi:hypothetical protein
VSAYQLASVCARLAYVCPSASVCLLAFVCPSNACVAVQRVYARPVYVCPLAFVCPSNACVAVQRMYARQPLYAR